ncbi:MAG: amidohydrolase [Planctomycetaceae bacterium]|nr:amidohydrolase [Planctomycetaceae bacterium]
MTDRSIRPSETISRRTFCRRAAWAAGTAVAITGPFGARADDGAADYIDVHVHLGQPWAAREPLTADILLRWMDEHRISHAVVLPLISPEAWYYPITTEWVLKETKPHRDRLLPFCDVDPRTDYLRGQKGILDTLKRYVDAGAVGFGEHKCGTAIDDPLNLEVFRAASELKLPILFHMDNRRNTDRPGLPGLEKALQEAPESAFIGHAQGWWASISGDVAADQMGSYPKTPVAPGGAIDRLMDKYPNLYGDFSAGSGANSLSRDPAFGRDFLLRRADRLLFGTDYLTPDQDIPQFKLFEQFDLPGDVRRKIFRANAERLLGLA